MPETVKNIAELILKYLKKELNEEEQDELIDWVNQSEENRITFEKLTDPAQLSMAVRELSEAKDQVWQKFLAMAPGFRESEAVPPKNRISWQRISLAILIVVLLFAGVYYIFQQRKEQNIPEKNVPGNTDSTRPEHDPT